MADKILTRVLGVTKSKGLDKYQLGLIEIFFRTNILAFLENLRTTRLGYYTTVIQKSLKARYYYRKYLEIQDAIILIQSIIRKHLTWKYIQETRKIKATTII
jgi:myosin V